MNRRTVALHLEYYAIAELYRSVRLSNASD